VVASGSSISLLSPQADKSDGSTARGSSARILF
jgi:hypothetical protein